jgi:hypothetical protein
LQPTKPPTLPTVLATYLVRARTKEDSSAAQTASRYEIQRCEPEGALNLRHAAAITLMGWYLLVAPGSCKPEWPSQGKPLPCAAPLSEWIVTLSFSSHDECDAERRADVSYGKQEMENANDSHDKMLFDSSRKIYWRALTELCISTDDPRLRP